MQKNRHRRRILAAALLISFGVLIAGGGKILAAQSDISGSVAQSYGAGAAIQPGMLVRLKDNSADSVVPLEKENVKKLLGVVVPAGSSPVEINPGNTADNGVLVAKRGINAVLVSNQNGAIETGDLITVSALDGVGMRATDSENAIVGKAGQGFDGQKAVISTAALSSISGSQTVALGRINVDLSITSNPAYAQRVAYVPGFITKAVASLVDKPVTAARIYLSIVIICVAAFISGSMLFGGARGGMIAIGRNPLSKKTIGRGLLQSTAVAFAIFAIGLLAVYLLLKL